jgi:ferric-dicitrate binding protein FerR (iron transport regulator)
VRCDDAATTLTELAEGLEPSSDAAARHIARCLRCQAQLAQHRRVRRSMRALRSRTVEPGPGLLGDILASLEAMADHDHAAGSRRRRLVAAAAAGAGAALAAGLGVFVLVGRARRGALTAPPPGAG